MNPAAWQARPFIPAWLDDIGLSPATFRVFGHLCRSADNSTGIAWPSYARMIEITGCGKSTVRRSIDELEKLKLIQKAGKPFGGSCRYRVLPIVPPQGQKEDPNSSTTGTIEPPPIVPPQDCNSPSSETSIVPPEGQEGNPIRFSNKVLHKRDSVSEIELPFSSDEFKSAWNDWKQHRSEIKKKITPTSANKQLKELGAMGEPNAIAAINHSIAKGYTGIFPPSQQQAVGTTPKTPSYKI